MLSKTNVLPILCLSNSTILEIHIFMAFINSINKFIARIYLCNIIYA